MELPITPAIDEVSVLPQVGSVDELLAESASCFCELLSHQPDAADPLLLGASSLQDGEVDAPAWWSDSDAHLWALHLFKVRDAYVFPAWGVVVTRDGHVMRLTMEEARYGSPDLAALPHMARRGAAIVLDLPDAVERWPAAAVTIPWGALQNYGHFVIDCLPSLATLDDLGTLARFPPLAPVLKPWQARHVALLGIDAPRITSAPVLHVDEVIYTSGMHHFLHRLNLNLRGVAERQRPRVAPAAQGSARRLYLSRGARNRRPMVSEGRLMRALASAGFEAIDTGLMSVDDQIARFAAADVVLGATGAAFANAIYCRPGTRIIEIQPAGMENHWVQGLCLVCGLHHAAYFCGSRPADPRSPERGLTFALDLERLLAFVFGLPPLDATPPPTLGSSGIARLWRGWRA